MPFEDYPKSRLSSPDPRRLAKPQLAAPGKPESQAGGLGFLGMAGIAGISAIGTYFTTKSQIRSQERGWEFQLKLEQMRIEAQKELERMRNTIDPGVYAMLKKELTTPVGVHGGGAGAGKPPTGTYRKMLEPQQAQPMGGAAPGRGGDLDKYLMGG